MENSPQSQMYKSVLENFRKSIKDSTNLMDEGDRLYSNLPDAFNEQHVIFRV
ncbi:hypothetical protein MN116_008931 [Schistosoma mekongi]|uniref:Uncharacterized protein n=1 Tax=Schistosoma mekongi TaxID=38744 RepID=A0AAE2D1B3_SCHME|nr:hypothetical protein MN116_008931 [Schistosoma mekongi]